jgi:hypothetical protein
MNYIENIILESGTEHDLALALATRPLENNEIPEIWDSNFLSRNWKMICKCSGNE